MLDPEKIKSMLKTGDGPHQAFLESQCEWVDVGPVTNVGRINRVFCGSCEHGDAASYHLARSPIAELNLYRFVVGGRLRMVYVGMCNRCSVVHFAEVENERDSMA